MIELRRCKICMRIPNGAFFVRAKMSSPAPVPCSSSSSSSTISISSSSLASSTPAPVPHAPKKAASHHKKPGTTADKPEEKNRFMAPALKLSIIDAIQSGKSTAAQQAVLTGYSAASISRLMKKAEDNKSSALAALAATAHGTSKMSKGKLDIVDKAVHNFLWAARQSVYAHPVCVRLRLLVLYCTQSRFALPHAQTNPIPVSDTLLQEKARDIAAEFVRKIQEADGDCDEKQAKSAPLIRELQEFKASKGWLDKWKQRFDVVRFFTCCAFWLR